MAYEINSITDLAQETQLTTSVNTNRKSTKVETNGRVHFKQYPCQWRLKKLVKTQANTVNSRIDDCYSVKEMARS